MVVRMLDLQQKVAATDGISKPAYYDIDLDGKKDLITGSQYGKIYIYKNYGTTSLPVFSNSYFASDGNGVPIGPNGNCFPDVTDWNGDGLPDIIVGAYKSVVLYTNAASGSGSAPIFEEAGGIPALDSYTNIVYGSGNLSVKVVSYDGMSSNDLLVGISISSGYIEYYKNIGTFAAPVLTNMGNLKDDDGSDLTFIFGPSALMYDWNNDGTNELIVSDMNEMYIYITTNNYASWNKIDNFYLSPEMIYSKLESCGDINGDGLTDLLSGEFTGGLFWLTNAGNTAEAAFSTYMPVRIAKTNVIFGNSSPVVNVWDFNGDGLADISLRRVLSAGMRMYPNLGDLANSDFEWFELQSYSYNYSDRFYTFASNQFKYFLRSDVVKISTNSGSYSSPAFATEFDVMEGANAIYYESIFHSGFDVADLNNDGKLDFWMILYGTNYWFENTNDNFTPIYTQRRIPVDNNASQMIFQTNTKFVPEIYDWNDDGKQDLLVADSQGKIHYYENISGYPPIFVDNGVLEVAGEGELDYGNVCYSFGIEDIDNNGYANLFVGFADGTVHEYEAVPEPGTLFFVFSIIIYIGNRKLFG